MSRCYSAGCCGSSWAQAPAATTARHCLCSPGSVRMTAACLLRCSRHCYNILATCAFLAYLSGGTAFHMRMATLLPHILRTVQGLPSFWPRSWHTLNGHPHSFFLFSFSFFPHFPFFSKKVLGRVLLERLTAIADARSGGSDLRVGVTLSTPPRPTIANRCHRRTSVVP